MAQWCLHQDTFDCFNISSSWTTFLFCTFVLMCLLFIVRCRTFELHIIQSSRNVFVSIALSRTILIFVCNEIAFGFWFIFYCFWLSNIWQLLHTSIYFLETGMIIYYSNCFSMCGQGTIGFDWSWIGIGWWNHYGYCRYNIFVYL